VKSSPITRGALSGHGFRVVIVGVYVFVYVVVVRQNERTCSNGCKQCSYVVVLAQQSVGKKIAP
jgi:hypothetical protein